MYQGSDKIYVAMPIGFDNPLAPSEPRSHKLFAYALKINVKLIKT